MPQLVYSVGDFQAFTKIRSADVNSKFTDIATLLNTTKLDDDNIQDEGITRSTKLSNSSNAHSIVVNDANNKMSEIAAGAAGTILIGKGAASAVEFLAAGVQGQVLQSNGSSDPSWVDSSNPTPSFYVKSGAVNADGQQDFLRAAGGGADDLSIEAGSTDLLYVIGNVEYTLSSDVNLTGLDAPATTNNTASLNDARASDQEWTSRLGERIGGGGKMTYDSGGTNFLPTSGAGQLHGFKINDGASDEYFIGRFSLDSTSTSGTILDCRRGYFVNSSGTPIPRLPVADNDTLTIQKLYWIFVDDAGAGYAIDEEPVFSQDEPSGPSTGDYWFDSANNTWKIYDGATFNAADRCWLGYAIVDENDEVVGTRSRDFYSAVTGVNTIDLDDFNTTIVKSSKGGIVNVLGNNVQFSPSSLSFDITDTDVRVGAESSSTYYSVYITKDGAKKIEATFPYYREDLLGAYHPHKPWRCVGEIFNDSGSDITQVESEFNPLCQVKLAVGNGKGSTNTAIRRFQNVDEDVGTSVAFSESAADGALFTVRRDRRVALSYSDTDGDRFGISKNATDLTQDINNSGFPTAERLAITTCNTSNPANCGVTGFFPAGTALRPHTSGGAGFATDNQVGFQMVVVG